jgi:HK97 family phage prohead protease
MPERTISVDEFLSKRGSPDGRFHKASKAPASWSDNNRSATFTMSTQQEDRDGDIVFTAGIDITEFMKNPVALPFHKSRDFPIGTWGDLTKGPAQLDGVLTFLDAGVDETADKMAAMVKSGVMRACSIGFIPKDIAIRTMEDGTPTWSYEIRACELVECSVVPIPSNPGALVKSADGDMRLAKELLEEVLDTWAKTPDGLLVPRAEYERTYKTVVERIAPKTTEEIVEEIVERREASLVERIKAAFGIKKTEEKSVEKVEEKAPAISDEEIDDRAAKAMAKIAAVKARAA